MHRAARTELFLRTFRKLLKVLPSVAFKLWATPKENNFPFPRGSRCILLRAAPILEVWLDEAKVLCILHHRGVQLILAYSCAMPAVLAAGKGRGECF